MDEGDGSATILEHATGEIAAHTGDQPLAGLRIGAPALGAGASQPLVANETLGTRARDKKHSVAANNTGELAIGADQNIGRLG